jgi:NAD(P)-dependent dehydrogenase (short-subunit alcohol dehydrogenase family)
MEYPAHSGVNFTQTLHNDIYPLIDPTKSDLSQPGKIVLITGSGRGIGRSIALRFAECAVACIILCARTTSELNEVEQSIKKINADVKVCKYTVDLTQENEVVALAEKVKNEGRLDILVNNAGMTNMWDSITEGDTKMYLKTWDLHIKGTYLMLKFLLPLMVETAKNHNVTVDVINTTSGSAHFILPGASAYSGSKFALMRLSEFVVVEYGDQGVNCLSLHPGGVPTQIVQGLGPWVQAGTFYVIYSLIILISPAMTDTPDLCGGFVTWHTKGQRAWLNGRYVSATWDVDELETKKDEIVEADKLKYRMVV